MPKTWLYYIALCMPLIMRVMIMNTTFTDWLWYHGYESSYYFFSNLSVNPTFLKFIGGWPLPVFVITVISFWTLEQSYSDDEEVLEYQFWLLPIMYVPFTVIGDFLITRELHAMNLFAHPVVIIPFGYMYVFMWSVFMRVMSRFRLVM